VHKNKIVLSIRLAPGSEQSQSTPCWQSGQGFFLQSATEATEATKATKAAPIPLCGRQARIHNRLESQARFLEPDIQQHLRQRQAKGRGGLLRRHNFLREYQMLSRRAKSKV